MQELGNTGILGSKRIMENTGILVSKRILEDKRTGKYRFLGNTGKRNKGRLKNLHFLWNAGRLRLAQKSNCKREFEGVRQKRFRIGFLIWEARR